MRPNSVDDIIEAYEQTLRTLRGLKDLLRAAVVEVSRLQGEIDAKTATVRELRGEVVKFCGGEGRPL